MTTHDGPTVKLFEQIIDAFNRHDLDGIWGMMVEDCSMDMPGSQEPWGSRFEGKRAVREALAGRFAGLPDVYYGDDRHWVSGNMGVSEWTLTGTTPAGVSVRVRGCDHFEFAGNKVLRKDSYWKIVESA
jgi:ketosteroid isomerase-like protein